MVITNAEYEADLVRQNWSNFWTRGWKLSVVIERLLKHPNIVIASHALVRPKTALKSFIVRPGRHGSGVQRVEVFCFEDFDEAVLFMLTCT